MAQISKCVCGGVVLYAPCSLVAARAKASDDTDLSAHRKKIWHDATATDELHPAYKPNDYRAFGLTSEASTARSLRLARDYTEGVAVQGGGEPSVIQERRQQGIERRRLMDRAAEVLQKFVRGFVARRFAWAVRFLRDERVIRAAYDRVDVDGTNAASKSLPHAVTVACVVLTQCVVHVCALSGSGDADRIELTALIQSLGAVDTVSQTRAGRGGVGMNSGKDMALNDRMDFTVGHSSSVLRAWLITGLCAVPSYHQHHMERLSQQLGHNRVSFEMFYAWWLRNMPVPEHDNAAQILNFILTAKALQQQNDASARYGQQRFVSGDWGTGLNCVPGGMPLGQTQSGQLTDPFVLVV